MRGVIGISALWRTALAAYLAEFDFRYSHRAALESAQQPNALDSAE